MNLLVPTYHYFHGDQPAGIKREDFAFSVGRDDFKRHCADLIATGYRLLDPEQPIQPALYRDEPDRQILLTIDDGHESIQEAVEIILEYKLKPVVNIIPGRVGTDHYLDWPTLRDMALKGFSLQSHSMQHDDLTRLSRPELKADLESAKKTIEDNIGLPVTMLAAPMGRINEIVVQTALETGYEIIMTSFTGINREIADLKYLRRFQIKAGGRGPVWGDYFRPYSGVRVMGAMKNMAKKIRSHLR